MKVEIKNTIKSGSILLMYTKITPKGSTDRIFFTSVLLYAVAVSASAIKNKTEPIRVKLM